jgi:DNA repair protein RecN (Recombination protein N)
LRIKNLALVEELEWQIGPGFVVVTGETGAGKSIIIGALQLLLGERADKSLIRTGADVCTVEAVFSGNDLQKLNPQLAEAGIEPCRRRFDPETDSPQQDESAVHQRIANALSVLKNLGDERVDLHGPHDAQSLLSSETQ